MYWIMFTERLNDDEEILYDVPKVITDSNLKCNRASHITGSYPLIELSPEGGFRTLSDNLTAPGFKGLLANRRVSDTLREVGANNIQEFPVLLQGVNDNQDCSDYNLINVIGDADIIDYDKSDVVLRRPGNIKRINALSFIDTSDMPLPYVFRLTSFLPLIIAHDRVKQAFEAKNITGFTFYKPEDFSL
ncbi:imm11 family protein [Shewanella surugensis]|uniref:Immunity MXAN-0049 protein domain-containing protein n=1 Tax=Shewanella surugensis TaxID=212020 RepID=A0ABT0LGW8_9GAMM|nr:hypothetical protein [Shewanella surugensis]MCL1126946.1 hypothetical protein [Shewanella surugensis]